MKCCHKSITNCTENTLLCKCNPKLVIRFFINLLLARKRDQYKVTVIGTMRKSKPDFSTEFTVAKERNMKSTVFGFQQDTIIASHCPKKKRVVNILSAMLSHPEIKSNSHQKRSNIMFYNKTKDAVYTLNRMVRSYSTKRMSRSWPLIIFYNMIDISAINAFIIWQKINHKNVNICMRQRRKFRLVSENNCVELQKKHNLLHQFLKVEKELLLLPEIVFH